MAELSGDYEVRRSARARRARLTISRAGRAVVVLPAGAPERLAGDLVTRHGAWLERHRARLAREDAALAARPPLGEGRTLTLGGVAHSVVLRPLPSGRRRARVILVDGPVRLLVVETDDAGGPAVARLLTAWLRREARRQFAVAVARRAAEMGVGVTRLSVRDQRTRWGSASRGGTLSFNWRLVLCPPEVLDYVVVHELAHLRWQGHGPRFWSLVCRHVPRADEHRRWLRENHRLLRAALD